MVFCPPLGLPAVPAFVVAPENRTLNVGESLTLNCSATGNPTPVVVWMKVCYTSCLVLFSRLIDL